MSRFDDIEFGDVPKDLCRLVLGNGTDDFLGVYEEELLAEGAVPFGWVPEDLADDEDTQTLEQLGFVPEPFELVGNAATNDEPKVALYDAREEIAKRMGLVRAPYVNQTTGSCVGAAGGNALLTLRDIEIVIGNEAEEPNMIWWPYAYGEGREKAGMKSKGSGSFGRVQAWAMQNKGNLPAVDVLGNKPFPIWKGWYKLDRSIELEWSDGDRREADRYDASAYDHRVETVARIRSAEDLAVAIQNGYPATIACRFGTRRTTVKGDRHPVRIANWDASWAHQQSVLGWWDHPEMRGTELFFIMNQWHNRHGKPEDGSPWGGYWVTKRTMERMIRGGECYTFSRFQGFPARDEMARLRRLILGGRRTTTATTLVL